MSEKQSGKFSDSFIDNADKLINGKIYSLFHKESNEHKAIECSEKRSKKNCTAYH